MATMAEPTSQTNTQIPFHEYHAEAHVLSGELKKPIEHKLERHAHSSLNGRRAGHFTSNAEGVSLQGLVTTRAGYSRVSGGKSLKHNGWVTLSTSVLEGLNVFEVVTADRVVSQVSTDHTYENGHFPSVTFLGSQFANLRVSGIPVNLEFDYAICGDKPTGDRSYLEDFDFLTRVQKQTESIAKAKGLPPELKTEYDKRLATITDLIAGKRTGDEPHITCSLIKSIGELSLPGVRSFGHVLLIPEFGYVSLGEIEVGEKKYDPTETRPSNYFKISIIECKLGCIGDGHVQGPVAMVNGTHKP